MIEERNDDIFTARFSETFDFDSREEYTIKKQGKGATTVTTWKMILFTLGSLTTLVLLAAVAALPRYRVQQVGKYLKEILEEPEKGKELPRSLQVIGGELFAIRTRLVQQEEELREQERRRQELIAFLAHDLKTPLTSVLGYLELLQDEPGLSPEQRAKYTGVALDKARRLEELIGEFFDITRFSLQDLPLEKESFDLSLMLRQLADEFYPALEERGMEVRVEAADSLACTGDPNRLARVFNNLLKNAVTYGTSGSTIFIRADRPKEHQLRIRFENQGRPIPPERLPHIFEKFVRLDESRSGNTGGAGLGLAIAREIVERHGGTIGVQSDELSTRFTVLLPCGRLAHLADQPR